MMMKHIYTIFLSAILLAGCAPKVVTDMFTNEWPATSPDSVRLFRMNEAVPPHSLAIGDVKVVDNGLSIGGTYSRVLRMAIDATAQNGGNGLIITGHNGPDHFSTIHRVWGTMLRMPETAVAIRDTTDSVKSGKLQPGLSEEEFLELEYRKAQQANEEYQQYYAEQQQRIDELRRQSPRNVVRLSVGPSLLCSEYKVGNHLYKSRLGYDICVDYVHAWKGFSLEFNYMHDYTSFDEGIKTRLNYIGPSLVLAAQLTHVFRCDFAFGMGYCHYTESYGGITNSENRPAILMRMGTEWKVAKHLGLGVQANLFRMTLKKPEDVELEKNEFYGIQHVGLLGGVRFYF